VNKTFRHNFYEFIDILVYVLFSIHNSSIQIDTNNSDHGFVKKEMAYIVIGSATNLWTKTVTWLLQQEAKKIIFVINGTNSVMRRSQRTIYTLIQKYPDVSFIMTSAERFNTIKEGERLLREFASYSKIEALFCVEMVYILNYTV